MSYCIAFSVDGGAVDVSRAYIPSEKWEEATEMRRKAGREEDGEMVLQRIRDRRRNGLPDDEKNRLEAEDERDRTWWKESASATSVGEEGLSASASDEALLPRQSGTQEWKEQRGEAGESS